MNWWWKTGTLKTKLKSSEISKKESFNVVADSVMPTLNLKAKMNGPQGRHLPRKDPGC